MDIKTFYRGLSKDELKKIAAAAGTTDEYIRQVVFGHRRASCLLAKKLHDASDGGFAKHVLRPEIFDEPKQQAA